MHVTAKQLIGSGIPLGILPAGSANGMAKELGIPMNVENALNVVLTGEVSPVDVIRIRLRKPECIAVISSIREMPLNILSKLGSSLQIRARI